MFCIQNLNKLNRFSLLNLAFMVIASNAGTAMGIINATNPLEVVSATATFDYIAPFKDHNHKVILSIQGLASGKNLSFISNFIPKPGWGECFGLGQYPSMTTTPAGDKYVTIVAAGGGVFNFSHGCNVMGTDSGNSAILSGVTDPRIYSVTIDGNQLTFLQPCATNNCKDPGNGYDHTAYYAQWAVWGRQYNPYTIPFDSLNHIRYAFIGFDPVTGDIKSLDADADSWGFSAISRSMRQYPYMHASLSFGGWTNNGVTTAPMFQLLSQSDASMQNFANQAIKLMRLSDFDGIDIDWEWWSDYRNNQAPAKQTLKFFSILKKALDQAGREDAKQYQLTIAVNSGRDRILALQDTVNNVNAVADYWAQVGKLVDKIDIMSYDLHGSFLANMPAYFQANANFTGVPAGINVGQAEGWSIQDAVTAYIANGVSGKNIVVGIPLYARTMRVAVAGNYGGLFQNVIGAGYGDYEDGMLDYKCLTNPVSDPVNGCGSGNPIAGVTGTSFYNSSAAEPNLTIYNNYGKDTAQPWGYNSSTNSFVTYDDIVSAAAKAKYVKQTGLGGIMYWELDGDSTDPTKSIIKNTRKVLGS